jgi:hypothetical protein
MPVVLRGGEAWHAWLHPSVTAWPRDTRRRCGVLVFVPASEQQRAKVTGRQCLVCGESPVDPAHLAPRSLAGRDRPECVVPLCRLHHRSYDRGGLELLPYLEPDNRGELARAL